MPNQPLVQSLYGKVVTGLWPQLAPAGGAFCRRQRLLPPVASSAAGSVLGRRQRFGRAGQIVAALAWRRSGGRSRSAPLLALPGGELVLHFEVQAHQPLLGLARACLGGDRALLEHL